MKVIEALKFAKEELIKNNISFTEDELRWLTSHILNESKSYILLNSDKQLSPSEKESFLRAIEKRKNHYPMAYIIGSVEFYKSEFLVNESVLIPRPETELLVEQTLKLITDKKEQLKIVDFGCGSGCIGLSIIKELVNAEALLIDKSEAAISVASENAKRLSLSSRVHFLNKNIDELSQNEISALNFSNSNLVVSNPPYISRKSLDVEVSVAKYEPELALYGGELGWEKYPLWAQRAYEILKPGGFFVCEIGYDQKEPLSKIFENSKNWQSVKFLKDYSGRDRILLLEKENNNG